MSFLGYKKRRFFRRKGEGKKGNTEKLKEYHKIELKKGYKDCVLRREKIL